MSVMNMIEALNSAHKVMMARDPDVVVFGEDVGYFGGVFRVTAGLQKEFGTSRVFDAPIAEGGIAAAAIGMGLYGLKPVCEIQFADYIFPGFDQIFSEAGRIRYRTAGEWSVPMVIRSPYGGGIFGGQTHSQSPEAFFAHMPGIKTVIPSNPHDAKGLLIAAIEDPDPVLFFEPKRIYNGPFDGFYERPVTPWAKHKQAEVPEGHSTSDDPTAYRPQGAGAKWPLGDPIERLKRHLIKLGEWDEERHGQLQEELSAEVRSAQKEAEKKGTLGNGHFEDVDSMFADVFEEVPWHLAEQREAARAEMEARRK